MDQQGMMTGIVGAGGGAMREVPYRQKQTELVNFLDKIEEAIAKLGQRLETVLLPRQEEEKNPDGNKPSKGPMSPLVSDIEANIVRLHEIDRMINGLIVRLEI
ncbi:MAG: hypothetical protein U1E51_07105 [Candidatus Binatia bacterium]|nr:hypothetical protein [Candidatus Binatia bacterium]